MSVALSKYINMSREYGTACTKYKITTQDKLQTRTRNLETRDIFYCNPPECNAETRKETIYTSLQLAYTSFDFQVDNLSVRNL